MSVMNEQMSCNESNRREALRNKNELQKTQLPEAPDWTGIDFVEPVIKDGLCSAATLSFQCPITRNPVIEVLDVRGGMATNRRGVQHKVRVPPSTSVQNPLGVNFIPPLPPGTYSLRVRDFDHLDPTAGEISFDVRNETTDVDPRPRDECPPVKPKEPEVNYLARDYQSFRQVILDRMALIMPDWRERHAADLGMTLVELLAYMGDHLSYYQDAVATEAYLGTARSRISVRRHARLVDYNLHEGCNARTFLRIEVDRDTTFDPRNLYFITKPQNPELKDKTVLAHHELDFERPESFIGFESVHVPMPDCGVEEWHGMNWTGFAAELVGPVSHVFFKSLRKVIPEKVIDILSSFVQTPSLQLPHSDLTSLIEALNGVLSSQTLWTFVGKTWSADIVAAAMASYAQNENRLPRLNRLFLQLAFPQYFSFCRSVDGACDDDPEPLLNLMFPEQTPKRVQLHEAHNAIRFYTWDQQNCCLPQGATSATLFDADQRPYEERVTGCSKTAERLTWDRLLKLRPGDLLLLQEMKGAKTGNTADADPARRQVVRLTKVCYTIDPIQDQPICEVEWSHEDKLRFPLCISSTASHDCRSINDVSLAFGNILLADHGITTIQPKQIGHVPAKSVTSTCCANDACGSKVKKQKPFQFELDDGVDLTFAAPVTSCQKASTLRSQKPHKALPALDITGIPVDPAAPLIHADQPRAGILEVDDLNSIEQLRIRLTQMSEDARWRLMDLLPPQLDDLVISNEATAELLEYLRQALDWKPQQHLMDSRKHDQHFALEIDNDRRTSLRFGNGREGKRPDSETAFYASYRVGNGPVGNIGQDKLNVAVYRSTPVTGIRSITNPLPAIGGADPETSQHAKMHAPHAFRINRQRAILVEDYREIVMRDFATEVQQVRATMARVGTRTVISISVDPFAEVREPEKLNEEIETHLRRFARVGHEVDVRPPMYQPLFIELKVDVHSGFLKGEIREELLTIFSTGILADGTRGFFHPDNLTFGSSIYLSRMVAAAKKVSGVANVEVLQMRRTSEGPAESQQHKDDGVLTLKEFEIPLITNHPHRPHEGSFVIRMRGGK